MDFLLNVCFTDFDRFKEEARAWQLDFLQIDRGAGGFGMILGGFGGCQLGRTRLKRRLLQRGCSPAGKRTFAISANPDLRMRWRGQEVSGEDLLLFPEDGELFSVSEPDLDMLTFSVPADRLDQACEEMELPEVNRLFGGESVVRLGPDLMIRVRGRVLSSTEEMERRRPAVGAAGGGDGPCGEVLETILESVAEARGLARGRPVLLGRGSCVRKMLEMVEDRGHEALTVREICRQLKVSERTLQYALKEHLGVGPKAYLQSWRLNQVNRLLCAANGGAQGVSDIANRLGFWHMGQFAADYRKWFGELPRETLARARAHRG